MLDIRNIRKLWNLEQNSLLKIHKIDRKFRFKPILDRSVTAEMKNRLNISKFVLIQRPTFNFTSNQCKNLLKLPLPLHLKIESKKISSKLLQQFIKIKRFLSKISCKGRFFSHGVNVIDIF